MLRRIALGSPSGASALEVDLHATILLLIKSLDNLRSSVCKNSMLAVSDLALGLGRTLDPELDTLLPVLLRKSVDTNSFLSEQARNATGQLIVHCSEQRVLNSLMNLLGNHNASIRASLAGFMDACVAHMGERVCQFRDLDRLVRVAVKCLAERSSIARDTAKQTLARLYRVRAVTDAAMQTLLTARQYTAVRGLAERPAPAPITGGSDGKSHHNGMTVGSTLDVSGSAIAHVGGGRGMRGKTKGGVGGGMTHAATSHASDNVQAGTVQHRLARTTPPSQTQQRRASGNSGGGVDSGQQQQQHTMGAEALESVQQTLQALDRSDWRSRFDALRTLTDQVTQTHVQALAKAQLVLTVMDKLCQRMGDGNCKVQTLAVDSVGRVVACMHPYFDGPVWSLVLSALGSQLVASNRPIQKAAHEVTGWILEDADALMVLPVLMKLVEHGRNGKVQAEMVECMCASSLLARVLDVKPALVKKRVVGLAFGMLEKGRGPGRSATHRLLRHLSELLGAGELQRLARTLPDHGQKAVHDALAHC
jgi:hypothetical protein